MEKILFKIFFSVVFVYLFFLSLFLPTLRAETTTAKENEKSTKEDDDIVAEDPPGSERQESIKQKREELEKVEEKIEEYQEEADKLTNETKSLKALIQKFNRDIINTEDGLKKTEEQIKNTEQDIQNKEQEIDFKEEELKRKRLILGEFIRIIERNSKKSTLEIILECDNLGEYFAELNSLEQTSKKTSELYNKIKEEKIKLEKEKEVLEEKRGEELSLKTLQQQQKIFLEVQKQEKDQLLVITQGKEEKFQKLLEEEQSVANRLTAELTALQSLGKTINFEEALKSAREASELTNVRVEFLLGVLRVESNMGSNVGGGRYDKDMHPAQRPVFEAICEELGYDPKDMPVSRKPCYRDSEGNCSGWGGAMGPAQFMPTTWKGYDKKVKTITKKKFADPWDLKHAMIAMALKLAKIEGVTEGKRKAEHKAANIYLAGGNWENFTWYGDRVMAFADAFEEKIEEEKL